MVGEADNRGATQVLDPAQLAGHVNSNVPQAKPKKRVPGATLNAWNNRVDQDKQRKQEMKQREEEAQARKGERQSFMYQQQPDLHDKGLSGQIAHLSGLTAEGLAGEAFADIMVFLFQFVFNSNYLEQCAAYQAARDKQVYIIAQEKAHLRAGRQYYEPNARGEYPDIFSLDEHGNPIRDAEHLIAPKCASDKELHQNGYFKRGLRMIYEPNEKGDYPVAYHVNSSTGALNYHSPIEPGKATPFEQIANGFVPNPSFLQGYTNVLYQHLERMNGFGSLSPEAKMWLKGSLGQENQSQGKEKDLASDLVSTRQPPAARPMKAGGN